MVKYWSNILFYGSGMVKYTWSKKSKKYSPLKTIKRPLKTSSKTIIINGHKTAALKDNGPLR